jgi:hypothetical protein
MAISKDEAYRLAKIAAELNAKILRGSLQITATGPVIGDVDVLAWLKEQAGPELLLIVAPVDSLRSAATEVKSCQTCGRDYEGDSCPHCANARARLRGK